MPPEKSKVPIYIVGGVVILLVVSLIGIGLYLALRKPAPAVTSPTENSSPSSPSTSSSPSSPTENSSPSSPSSSVVASAPLEPETFAVRRGARYTTTKTDAAKVCEDYGAKLATKAQLQTAQDLGADWCNTGWLEDDPDPWYPNQIARPGCGIAGSYEKMYMYNPGGKADVTCYGVKPNKDAIKSGDFVLRFNQIAGIYFQPPRTR
jgi:hypothetical protein